MFFARKNYSEYKPDHYTFEYTGDGKVKVLAGGFMLPENRDEAYHVLKFKAELCETLGIHIRNVRRVFNEAPSRLLDFECHGSISQPCTEHGFEFTLESERQQRLFAAAMDIKVSEMPALPKRSLER